MAESVLRLQNVSKYYYSETAVTQALRKINLEFQMGEFVAITGESGSGKSTLLNIISGLDSFDEGEMYFKGQPTFPFDGQDWEEYRRNEIGFVFQDYSLINHYTALDNVVAALVIQERETEQARQLALGYLEQVGLKEYAGQRASQLSSGQKQRLAIARALAKNTDIIVADEPTGNLDSETGIQVVQILEKLSKEKLVIMVTHNYEQAEPYVTRKIRLFDGEVMTDVSVNAGETEKTEDIRESLTAEETEELKNTRTEKKKSSETGSTNRMAGFFAWKNIRMQRGRAMLFFSFFLITAITSFLFIGELLTFADDRITKKYDTSAFLQENDTRLVVRYPDNREVTEEDRKKILSLKHVEEVDLYGYANDISYYYQEGKGYRYTYGARQEGKGYQYNYGVRKEIDTDEDKEIRDIEFLAEDSYVKSASCLTENDLAEGRLPKERNEIVLYSSDKKVLGMEQECYFTADNAWEPGEVYHTKVKVVGLLKEKTDQIYFDYRLCRMITCGLDGLEFGLDYYYDGMQNVYLGYMKFYPVIADDLTGTEIRISGNYTVPGTGSQKLPLNLQKAFAGSCQLHVSEKSDAGVVTEDMNRFFGLGESQTYVAKMGVMEEAEGLSVTVQTDHFTDQGPDIVEVSEELFQRLYDKGTTQASAYISSYGKTDKVINKLIEMGYDSVSTFRVGSTEYIEDKVYQRLEVIGISSLVLFALMILQILLVRSILKIKIKDYDVLKFMGMRMHQMKRITYLEMGAHCTMAVILALLLMMALYAGGISFIVHMMQYYTLWAVILYITYNILLMVLTVLFFHRLLKKKL